jgi:3-methyladenine DNA glycosylase AlkD
MAPAKKTHTGGTTALVRSLRRALAHAADPARAPGMQAYLKSEMPCLGVAMVPLRAICKSVFAGHQLGSAEEWRDAVLAIWRGARHREERYAAVELTADRRARTHQTLETVPMYEELIVTGAWWDFVDPVAIHRLGPLLAAEPRAMKKTLLAWSRSDDLWKRRSAIICQARRKHDTDLALLYACIEPALGEREFFLNKAIGWALREYSTVDADEVVRYVRAHPAQLSKLSKREALRHVLPADAIADFF